jgi:hypothetical protein
MVTAQVPGGGGFEVDEHGKRVPAGEPAAPVSVSPQADDVEALAAEIRRVDGSHSLGAGALAEALMPLLAARIAAAEKAHGERIAAAIEAHAEERGDPADNAYEYASIARGVSGG